MEEKKATAQAQPKKLTYEQLENIAHQLSDQVKNLYTQLQESNMENAFMRLKFLFKVLDHKGSFSTSFVENSIAEIEKIMTIPEEKKEKTTKE